jgi:hypothetical protein
VFTIGWCTWVGNESIGSVGGKAIGAALQRNTTLTSIDLRCMYWRVFVLDILMFGDVGTSIGDDGAKAIAEVLESNTTFTSIDLFGTTLLELLFVVWSWRCWLGTKIGDDGTKEIANALESNTTLKSINLRCKCFECHVGVYHWLMHVSRQSLDRFRWWQSDWSGIATQHNVDIDRSSVYVFASVLLWKY